MGNGAITTDDLMHKLVNAKKVMNKVESGNFERGNVNENMLRSSPEELQQSDIPMQSTRMVNPANNADLINKSKLPDAIKKAMRDNPIPQISLSETLDMDFVNKAKNLMKEEGIISSKPTSRAVITNGNIDMNAISTLIENTVRKVMDEKLNQLLAAHQTGTINENLVLKVGDSIFRGKITGVNKAK